MKGPLAGTVANGSCSGGTAEPLPAPASAPALGKQHRLTTCHRPRLTCTLPGCERKISRKEDVRYGPTAPGQPMSRSEVCCCIAGSETRSGLLLHASGNLPPNLPTSGCSQGGSMHCGCCAALYHCQRRAFGAVELWRKPASVPCLPARLWTGSGAASWRPPGSHGLRARPGLPSKPVPPCRRQTDPDSISGWDKKKTPTPLFVTVL